MRLLRGRFREAIEHGTPALAGAVAIGDAETQSEVLNSLGMAHIALGEVEQGRAELRQSLDIARSRGDIQGLATSYSNLADLLSLAGRTQEALQVAKEGLHEVPTHASHTWRWLILTAGEVAFEAGDWTLARRSLAPDRSRPVGRQLILQLLREAELALAAGDDDAAAESLEQAAVHVAASTEPQWIGSYGVLRAEVHLRRGEPLEARRAVAAAVGRLEVCTDDVMRVARISAMGVRVEATLAQRARDLRQRSAEREALARARIEISRLRAAASEGGPVERAWRAVGEAELARGRGAGKAELWLKAAAAWEEVERPYRAALAHWRAAECLLESGERTEGSEQARLALAVAEQLGASWLAAEVRSLAARARLALPAETADGDGASGLDGSTASTGRAEGHNGAGGSETVAGDAFGLTRRERQVLALVAQGATNRQIGEALFMAEKTASVHVSRILAKLGVQGRTQAAAVAYRQHLV